MEPVALIFLAFFEEPPFSNAYNVAFWQNTRIFIQK